jgi:hypothetical protein
MAHNEDYDEMSGSYVLVANSGLRVPRPVCRIRRVQSVTAANVYDVVKDIRNTRVCKIALFLDGVVRRPVCTR